MREFHWIQCYSPKSCLKEAKKVGIIEDLKIYFNMVEARNITSYTYDEEKADVLVEEIERFLPYIKSVYEKIKESIREG